MYPSIVPDAQTVAAILAVADEGGMAAAARVLFSSQQAVSTRVAGAERRLGFTLFERSARGCTPTAKGHQVIAALRSLHAATETCRAELGRIIDPTLRIAASHTVAEYDLPGWITGPVRVTQANSHEAQEMVQRGEVDVAFIEGLELFDALSSRTIKSDELTVVVPLNHPFGDVVSAAELARVPMVMRERGSGTREVIEHQAQAAGVRLARPAAEFASLASQRRAIVALGVPGVLPKRTLGPDVRAIRVPEFDLRREIRAVWKTLTPPVIALLDRAAQEG